MDEACNTHEREQQCNVLVEERQGRNCAEHLGINGRIILK
jgi:hypothetical protein